VSGARFVEFDVEFDVEDGVDVTMFINQVLPSLTCQEVWVVDAERRVSMSNNIVSKNYWIVLDAFFQVLSSCFSLMKIMRDLLDKRFLSLHHVFMLSIAFTLRAFRAKNNNDSVSCSVPGGPETNIRHGSFRMNGRTP
jgi:hypothetical protein